MNRESGAALTFVAMPPDDPHLHGQDTVRVDGCPQDLVKNLVARPVVLQGDMQVAKNGSCAALSVDGKQDDRAPVEVDLLPTLGHVIMP